MFLVLKKAYESNLVCFLCENNTYGNPGPFRHAVEARLNLNHSKHAVYSAHVRRLRRHVSICAVHTSPLKTPFGLSPFKSDLLSHCSFLTVFFMIFSCLYDIYAPKRNGQKISFAQRNIYFIGRKQFFVHLFLALKRHNDGMKNSVRHERWGVIEMV